jgi:DNA polymerase
MMDARDARDLWDELSLVEDWLSGGLRRAHPAPDFTALEVRLPPAAAKSADPEAAAAALGALGGEIATCRACGLSAGRINAVAGAGAVRPLVLVVGEGPGAEEDESGLPFVGAAGKLLDRMLASIGVSRETNAYIANVVKCRPPANRDPAPDEIKACMGYLERQVEALAPRAILCLGRTAVQALTGSTEGITRLRGRWFDYRGIPLIATFHPSALLRDETLKRPAWEDLKALRDRLGDVGLR